MSSFWWNSRVTSFFPVAHWDTLESGISNAVFSFISNCNRGPVMGDTDKKSSWQLYLNLVREKHLYLGKNVLLDFFISLIYYFFLDMIAIIIMKFEYWCVNTKGMDFIFKYY